MDDSVEPASLIDQFTRVRQLSERLCEPLQIEDYSLQAMAETSPAKWHLAHTSWFFETFILKPFEPGYQCWHAQFEYLFNSYYNGVGAQFPRPQRGLLSRPAVKEVYDYRHYVTEKMLALLTDIDPNHRPEIISRLELGIHHEQQHQELFFTDLKYCWSKNPLYPVYCNSPLENLAEPAADAWLNHDGGEVSIGRCRDRGFCFDNEEPEHAVLLAPFAIANRLVSNADYRAFIDDGGYQRPEMWLSDGWAAIKQQQWQCPLYWRLQDGQWLEYTLHGMQPVNPAAPVCHLSFYEADAYARWAGARLPTEFEWEVAADTWAGRSPLAGQFLESERYHPLATSLDFFGSVWQWTSSAYLPYPGYQPAQGAVGEYNGKFMCSQWVLRGGSCVSSRKHLRSSYRNFFYPADRWQFTGLRLVKNNTDK